MNPGRDEERINAWWRHAAGERYWLDVTGREAASPLLATPRGDERASANWSNGLITHVRAGDFVFHWDARSEAIDAVSIASGRVRRMRLHWRAPTGSADARPAAARLDCWAIALRRGGALEAAASSQAIARIQWSLFSTLRALEDAVGFPLYYPFEMGDPEATRPLPGYLFKLPAVLVLALPALAGAVDRTEHLRAA